MKKVFKKINKIEFKQSKYYLLYIRKNVKEFRKHDKY